MSAAITPLSAGRAPALLAARPAALGRSGSWLHRLGSRGLVACGLGAQLLWGFVGSLVMGLRGPDVAHPLQAMLWLAGAGLLAALALAAGILVAGKT